MRQFKGLGDLGSIAFSPDGKYILTAPDDGTARLLDVASGRQLRIFDSHAKAVTAVAFSPDGKFVLTASSDGIARLWGMATGQQVRTLSGQAAAFAPDGKTILTGSADKAARLWDVATGRLLRLFVGHAGSLNDVAFSPDGKYVLTGSADKTARLWLTDIQDVIQLACSLLRRDLTADERATYNIVDEAPTCPKP